MKLKTAGFFILVLMTVSMMSHVVMAQSIELEAPPLLWEEAPKEQKYDDKDYWKRKYGLRKKGTKALEEKAGATITIESKASQSDVKQNVDEIKENSEADSPSDKAEETAGDKKSSVVVDQVLPECKFDWAKGQKVEDIDFEKFGERPVRVVYRGQSLTKDVNLERVNLKIAGDGTVAKIACF